MLWTSFRVLNVLCHYVTRALRPVFLVLTATVTSFDESCISRLAALTFRVKDIITVAFDHWIDIRCSGLFSSFGLEIEF